MSIITDLREGAMPGPAMLAAYLIADYGDVLAVEGDRWWIADGSLSGYSADATAKCPGILNLDSSVFEEGWVTRQDDGSYVVTGRYHDDQGRVIPDLETMISECCRDGDVSDFSEDLRAALLESAGE